ncbi:MAG: SPOR domain-containing protein, partial [Kofleriaceae bacterium]|nr:SPOR domain-containing protein [Kofleriaceae bacterium]
KALKAEAQAKAERAAAQAEEAKRAKRKFTLQVGSFQDKSEADTFFRQLENTSYKPYMVEAEIPGKGQYYRVRVGGFGTFDEAVEAKAQFEDSQHVIAYVTRLK